jgi:hypothetical protein
MTWLTKLERCKSIVIYNSGSQPYSFNNTLAERNLKYLKFISICAHNVIIDKKRIQLLEYDKYILLWTIYKQYL